MRPKSITILSAIFGAIWASQLIRDVISLAINPGLLVILSLLTASMALYACWGLWNMRRWSTYLFSGICILYIVIFLLFPAGGPESWLKTVFFTLLLVVFWGGVFPHWKRLQTGGFFKFR